MLAVTVQSQGQETTVPFAVTIGRGADVESPDFDAVNERDRGMAIRPPTLTNSDTGRTWIVVIRVVADGHHHDTNGWPLDADRVYPISRDAPSEPLPTGAAVQWWKTVVTSGGTRTRYPPTYLTAGKNIGRANATTALQQAIREAAVEWAAQIAKRGFRARDAMAANPVTERVFPMAAHPADETPSSQMTWPAYHQAKLDGTRCMAHHVDSTVELYSRSRKPFDGHDAVRVAVHALMGYLPPDVHIDGEFYLLGHSLQQIQSFVTRPGRAELQYWIFDIYLPSAPALTFTERFGMLAEAFAAAGRPPLVLVTTTLVDSRDDFMRLHMMALRNKLEGSMWRRPDGVYETSRLSEKRSYGLLKVKPTFDSEYPVTGVEEGTGTNTGAVIWVLEVPEHVARDGRIVPVQRFTSVPNETITERRRLLIDARRYPDRYVGRMATVEYRALSEDGIPLRARVLGLRDKPPA